MVGYDKKEAHAFILKRIHSQDHPALADRLGELVAQAIDADLDFMAETGVIGPDGLGGDSYYEEDDAFEYIVERLAANNDLDPEQAVKVASLVDDFMDAQYAYMMYAGLVQDE